MSDGKLHDVNALDYLIPMPGAYYVMDRGYLDFGRLYQLHQAKAYFVTRAKKNFAFKRRYSHEVDKAAGVQCDQTVVLETFYSSQRYPEPLRRIRYYNDSFGKHLVFLTNDFDLPATTIAALCKSRWQIELFFKWIKQHLRINEVLQHQSKRSEGPNLDRGLRLSARAILKKRFGLEPSLYTILQILSVSIFEKTPLVELFSQSDYNNPNPSRVNQLLLFD